MNKIRHLLILSLLLVLISFVFVQPTQAANYSYSATDFQSTLCPFGGGFGPLNLTEAGDIVTIVGTSFGTRDVSDSTPEVTYISIANTDHVVYRGQRVDAGGEVGYFGLQSWTDNAITLEITKDQGGLLNPYIILRTYDSSSDNQGHCVRGTLATYIPPPPTCTTFTYSDWGTCTDSQQTRTATSSSPAGCTGGSPVLTQSCTVAPPTCTESDWSCPAWGSCSEDGQQTRTSCTKVSNCEGGVPMPQTSQNCTPTCASWTYSNWGECSAAGQRTRTILSSSPTSCTGGNPELTMICTPPTACTADTWTCGEWATCSADGSQIRTCTLTSDCAGVDTPSPAITQTCTYNGPTIASISPTTIYQGTSVILNGTKFIGLANQYQSFCYNCKVLINDKEVTDISYWVWYENKVSFTMPSTAQSGYIQVQDSKGNKSNKFNFTVSQDPATIPPIIMSFSPKVITPGDTITITGSNFGPSQGSSQLIVGGRTGYGKILSWADTEIKYQTSDYGDNKSQKIGVKKCRGYYECLPVVYGEYFYIQPQITSLDTNIGREGMEVTIYGKYLSNSNVASDASTQYFIHVYFNGVSALYPQNGLWTSDQIEVVVPRGATSGKVTLEITANNTNETVKATGPTFNILEKISNDEYSDLQEYFKQINLPQAWGVASNRRTITVAVIDDGVYNNHPDLKNKMWYNTDEVIGNGIDDDRNGYVDDYYGWDFVNNSNDVTPLGSHGTQVAGIIGAEKDNAIGIAGVNWNVKIMPLIVCGNNGGCIDTSRAIRYAVDNGAEVINLSLGTRAVSGYTTMYNDAIEYAFQRNALIVTSAGNGDIVGGIGFDLSQIPQSPVCNSDQRGNRVIGVGAVDSTNHRTKWSNYGSCVDIWAPGVQILSTAVPAFSNSQDLYEIVKEKTTGTSFAAPIITGIVSLLKATYPTMTSQEAITLLVNNANGGIVDAYKTLSDNSTPANTQVIQAPVYNSSPVSNPTSTQNPVNNPPVTSYPPNTTQENYYRPLIESDATSFGVPLTAAQARDVTNFVVYSISQNTQNLGAGERRAVIRDYFETVVRGNVDWGDIERMVNGQKVVSRNIAKEQAQLPFVLKTFEKVFGHRPNFQDPKEDLSWNTMMYRIRFPRDLDKEKLGINRFKTIFGRLPTSPLDWSVVRALGYVRI